MRKNDQGSEFAKAKQYFSEHPDVKKIRRSRSKKGSSEFFSHSYIKTTHEIQDQQGHATTEERIYKVLSKQEGGFLGKGTYGRAKIVEDENGQGHVVKVMYMENVVDVRSSQEEAKITKQIYGSDNVSNVMYVRSRAAGESSSQDTGFLSENTGGFPRKKSYQVTPLLRYSMAAHMKARPKLSQHVTEEQKNVDFKTRIGFAIDLFTQLQLLHDKKIAHCDIKPENIVLGSAGELYFIDFGISKMSTETQPITQVSDARCGTPCYLPMHWDARLSDMQRDIFAAMRTCYYQERADDYGFTQEVLQDLRQSSIFNENAFERLPKAVQQLFFTSPIQNSRGEQEEDYQTILPSWKTPHFLAAVLILYQNNMSIDDRMLQTGIDILKGDPNKQEKLINDYYNNRAVYAGVSASATPTIMHPGKAAFDVVEIRSPDTPAEYIRHLKAALDNYAQSKPKNSSMFSLFKIKENKIKNLDKNLYTALSTKLSQVDEVDDKNSKNLDHANQIIAQISDILLQYDQKYKNIEKNATSSSSSLVAHLRIEGVWLTSESSTDSKLDTPSNTPKTPGCK